MYKRFAKQARWHKWTELGWLTGWYLLGLLPAFALEWIYDFPGVYYLYDKRAAYAFDTSLIVLLLALFLACCTQYLGRLQSAGFILITTFLTISGLIASAHVALYAAPISVGAIDAMLGTDLHEAVEYLHFQFSLKLALIVSGFLLYLLNSLLWLRKKINAHPPCPLAHSGAAMCLVALIVFGYQRAAVAAQTQQWPEMQHWWTRASLLNMQVPSVRMLVNIREWVDYRHWLKKNQDIRQQYHYQATMTDTQPRTVVLVLGESMRRKNLSLYGYARNTTPKLDARKDNLLVFDNAIAPANQTVPSISKLLTPATAQQPDLFMTRPSIITAAKEAGYQTWWISNQGRVGQFDSLISLFAHEADTALYTNTEFYGGTYDDILLHPLETALQNDSKLRFIIMHLQGSHQAYAKRYPKDMAQFHAADYQEHTAFNDKQRETLSEYDNSILYTDSILDQIMARLEQEENAVMLYVSDHGERFYENGVNSCGHGYPKATKSEVEVPYFIWCSNGCADNWVAAHRKNHKQEFSTENLFFTGMNVLALQLNHYQSEKDILSSDYQPTAALVQSTDKSVQRYRDLPSK